MAAISSTFLESIIVFLMPYFTLCGLDPRAARVEIKETLNAYAARTRAEMLQAAQIVALGMTTLDVLAEARASDMSVSMRARYRSCANGLNRSTLNTEKALEKRLAKELAAPSAAIAEPIDDLPDAEVQEALAVARAAIDSHRERLPAAHAPQDAAIGETASPTEGNSTIAAPVIGTMDLGALDIGISENGVELTERDRQLWAGAMRDTLQRLTSHPIPARSPHPRSQA